MRPAQPTGRGPKRSRVTDVMQARIGMVCPYSLSVPGGVQAQVLDLARAMRERGVQVRVLAPCDGPPPATFVTPLGNSIPTATNGSVAPIAPDAACTLRTIRAVWGERFDVLHVHEPLVPGPALTTLMVKPAPIVGTFHAAGRQPLYETLGWMARWFGDRLDLRVAVSEDAEVLARSGPGGEYVRLFNGIDVPRFAAADPWQDSDTESGRPIVFLIGRHEPRKGVGVLIDALGSLPPDAILWLAGTGPETAELQRRAAGDERVRWLGRISDEERNARLRAATVFCAPATSGESFGIILLEAMAAGTPVVAADNPGYRRVAIGGEGAPAAVLVPPGDAVALAEGIRSVLGDTPERQALIEAGRSRADQFSLSRLVDEYLALYARLLRGDEAGAVPPAEGPRIPPLRSATVVRR